MSEIEQTNSALEVSRFLRWPQGEARISISNT